MSADGRGRPWENRWVRWLAPTGAAVVLLLVWEAATRTGVLPRSSVPPVSTVAMALFEEVQERSLWADIGYTLQAWAFALLITAAVGIPLGLLIGSVRWIDRATRPVVEFFRPVPPVALIPVIVLVYGTVLDGAILLAVLGSVWPLVIQSSYGARFVDRVAFDTTRSLRLSRWRRLLVVTLPSAAPFVGAGLRISSAIALILVVTSGIIIGTPGLGHSITELANGGAYPAMYALILIAGALGLVLNLALSYLERRLLYWTPDARRGGGR